MATQPMFDDPLSDLEYKARTQLDLTDDWRLESSAAAIHSGLEVQIERLEQDAELDDDQRWKELSVDKEPLAWLPNGLMLITMYRKVDGTVERKAGFVNTKAGTLADEPKQLESVARVICQACDENPDHTGDCRGNEFRWQDYISAAKAAVKAMNI